MTRASPTGRFTPVGGGVASLAAAGDAASGFSRRGSRLGGPGGVRSASASGTGST